MLNALDKGYSHLYPYLSLSVYYLYVYMYMSHICMH